MTLQIIDNATCTFCGCVCDDIQLHHDEMRIHKANKACVLGTAWFLNHTAEKKYPVRPDRRPGSHARRGDRGGRHISARGRHAAGLRHEQHDLRGPEGMCRAGRPVGRPARQSHQFVTRSNGDRRPVGWQGYLYARRSETESRLHRVLGRKPGRVPSSPFHEVHHHAEEQVSAARPQGPHDGAGRYSRNEKRQGRRHLPAGEARQGFRADHDSASHDQGPQRWRRADRGNRPDARNNRRPDRPHESGQVRLHVLRHGPVDDSRQAHEQRRAARCWPRK